MDRITAHFTHPADGRLPGAESVDGKSRSGFATQFNHRAESLDRARSQFERSLVRDKRATLAIVDLRQQSLDRHLDEVGIAIEFLAVGKSELGCFHLQMDEVRTGRMQAV